MIWVIYLISFSHGVWSEGLERLFTTAQERHDLNQWRVAPPPPPPSPPIGLEGKISSAPPPLPEQIVFNGLVIRSQGSSTVWVNGSEELFRTNFRVALEKREGLSVPIVLSKEDKEAKEIRLKPGETISTIEGKVLESYEPRSPTQLPK